MSSQCQLSVSALPLSSSLVPSVSSCSANICPFITGECVSINWCVVCSPLLEGRELDLLLKCCCKGSRSHRLQSPLTPLLFIQPNCVCLTCHTYCLYTLPKKTHRYCTQMCVWGRLQRRSNVQRQCFFDLGHSSTSTTKINIYLSL